MRDTFVIDHLPPPHDQPTFNFDLPELHFPERMNAAIELIDRGDPDRLAVVNDAGQWTYRQMASLSDRIARVLVEQQDLIPGNRVLLRGPNGAMLFACWLGVLKAGGVAVTTMPMLRASETAAIVDRAKVSHALIDDRFLDGYASVAVAHTLSYHGDIGGGELEALIATATDGFTPVDTGRDDPALIAFTSGTTGAPKGCVHYHRDILAAAETFGRYILRPRADDRFLSSAPIAFTFGLGALVIFPWRFGGTAVTVEAGSPAKLLEAIARHDVTTLFTAPTAYKAMLALPRGDLASLHTCISAGEHLPESTWHAWRDTTGIRIINGIGATEMMHIFISAAGDDIRPGATGKAVPGFEACVLDAGGKPMMEGQGLLAVKGPTGCRYLDDARQSAYVKNGWNVTGDTYRIDDEGYFWYVARSDDMIVSSGYNIAAPEVENALYLHPAVQECAVIGVPCATRGSIVKAFVVRIADVSVEELQDHVKAMIAPYKYPREIEFLDALPKTATGKLQRFALRK